MTTEQVSAAVIVILAAMVLLLLFALGKSSLETKALQARLRAVLDQPAYSHSQAWHSLPGQRIELAATDWSITLGTQADQPMYKLSTPEGQPVATSIKLQSLKDLAARLATERAEFEPHLHPMAQADALRAIGQKGSAA